MRLLRVKHVWLRTPTVRHNESLETQGHEILDAQDRLA